MLKLDHVQKKYNDFTLDCSLELEQGRVTGLIGSNGAGKSTTFKAVLGLISIDGGTIEILDKDSRKISALDKQQIGAVLSESTFSNMLAIKDVIPVMKAEYRDFNKEWFLQKCAAYNLPLNKPLKEFSTGMKAKFKLLIAMSYGARLLILDEPTAGLDSVVRNEILGELREFMNTENRAVLISSHISTDLEGLCDDLYFLQNGAILFHEDTDVILSDYAIMKVNEEQYQQLDKRYVLYRNKRPFGYELLTNERRYYMDNYPEIVMEKGSIDEVMLMITKGEKL
ncbi:MAG: ABC transporter ATP-binding protein [Clostridiales bacterium]|nr:ABC transporter ATP-binding protein [Clostridiales bacterium]